MQKIRNTFSSFKELRDWYANSWKGGWSINPKSIAGIPTESRWSWVLSKLSELELNDVLEVGSWVGDLPAILYKNGYKVEAVEAVAGAAESSVEAFKAAGMPIKVNNCMIEDFESDKKYQAVVGLEMIEHVYDMDKFLTKVYSLLDKDGCFLFSTPTEHGNFGSHNFNDLHLWTATEDSLKASFSDKYWEWVELIDAGDLYLGCVRRKEHD